jgi:hypothetical protein
LDNQIITYPIIRLIGYSIIHLTDKSLAGFEPFDEKLFDQFAELFIFKGQSGLHASVGFFPKVGSSLCIFVVVAFAACTAGRATASSLVRVGLLVECSGIGRG